MAFSETKKRTISKTVLYRILIILSDSVVVFAFTRRIDLTVASIGVLTVANTLLYYFYERTWNNVKWGKRKHGRARGKKT